MLSDRDRPSEGKEGNKRVKGRCSRDTVSKQMLFEDPQEETSRRENNLGKGLMMRPWFLCWMRQACDRLAGQEARWAGLPKSWFGSIPSRGNLWVVCVFKSSLRPLFKGWNWERESERKQEN